MLDRAARRLIDPPLDALGRRLARAGIGANAVTLTGLVLGLLSALALSLGAAGPALALLLVSRLADGLDGAVARATRRTDFGGYLDITADFVVYSALPLAFALRDPAANGAAAAFLLASFYVNGASFLGFAILAEKRGLRTRAHGLKSLHFSTGLMEGTETILFLALICLAPRLFGPAAWVFGALCLLSAGLRLAAARSAFPDDDGAGR